MTYTAISVIGMDVYVVTDRIVSQSRLQCCQMVVTIYQQLVRLFPRTWQHHHLIITSTIAFIIQWQLSLTARDQYGKADPRLDASLLQCTLRSPRRKRAEAALRFRLANNRHLWSSCARSHGR